MRLTKQHDPQAVGRCRCLFRRVTHGHRPRRVVRAARGRHRPRQNRLAMDLSITPAGQEWPLPPCRRPFRPRCGGHARPPGELREAVQTGQDPTLQARRRRSAAQRHARGARRHSGAAHREQSRDAVHRTRPSRGHPTGRRGAPWRKDQRAPSMHHRVATTPGGSLAPLVPHKTPDSPAASPSRWCIFLRALLARHARPRVRINTIQYHKISKSHAERNAAALHGGRRQIAQMQQRV